MAHTFVAFFPFGVLFLLEKLLIAQFKHFLLGKCNKLHWLSHELGFVLCKSNVTNEKCIHVQFEGISSSLKAF